MRHRKTGVKLGRTSSHRDAMFRNMVTSLLKYDRIQTTDTKAKELRRWVDKIITLAKRGDLHARRQALAIVREKDVVHKLFEQASQRFGSIHGGYSRIVKIGPRPGDAAPMSIIELVSGDAKSAKSKKKRPKASKKESPAPSVAVPKPKEADEAAPVDAAAETGSAVQDAEATAPPAAEESGVEDRKQDSAVAEAASPAADAPTGEASETAATDETSEDTAKK